MIYAWLGAIIAFSVIEIMTAQLVSIWFAIGSLAAFIGASFGIGTMWQWILFAIFSAIALILTRPFIKKIKGTVPEKTNIDSKIGKTAVVTQKINNIIGTGEVRLDGLYWSARNIDDTEIEKESTVIIEKIDGVKLIVKKLN